MNKTRKRKAFTIVEIVIVIAVIAILASVLIPTFSGIIKRANKSADEQMLTSINLGIAMADEIKNEEDLAKAIDATYGEGAYAKIAPKSAKYGYHYWYDVKNSTVILKTYSEIVALNETSKIDLENINPVATAAVTVAKKATFADTEANNFRMFDNYFILDKGGSVVAESFEALNTGAADLVEKVKALENVKNSSDNKELADALLEKLNKTALVGNDMSYVRNVDMVEKIYFVPGITTIPTFDGTYIAKADNIKGNIIIPDTVTTVHEKALYFDKSGVKLQTFFKSADKIAEVFVANSTNATILSATNLEYTIDGGSLIGPDGNDNNLAYGNPVASFEVVIPEDTDDYKSVLNNIYVAYNYTGTIQLGVDSFKGVNGGAGSSQAVTWASDNEHVVVDKNNGTISINGLPDLEECTATITATAVAGGATSTAKVNIIRVAGYSVKLNGTLLSQNAAYEAEYKLDTPKSYTITVTPAFNFTEENVNITPDFSATVTASGNEFSYNGGTLSMVLDSNSNPVFTVKENETERTLKTTLTVAVSGMTRTYDIVFTDKSESPLEVALPNVSDYLYFLGNKNAIKLESLFKVKSGYSLSGDVSVKVVDIINSGEEETIVDVTLSNTIGLGKTLTLPTTFVGPVEIRVTAHGMTTSLYANVVDATNVTTYSELKNQNSVLLSDITMSNNSSYYLSNATLYGNGFTFDVRDGAYSGTGYGSNNYLVGISNANLDNVKIIGKVYTTYNITAAKDYNRATVLTSGDCRITNSYISNCAAPLRVGGVLYVENTTLKGGYFANIDFLNGQLTLKDVTTINQANLNDKADDGSTIVGFGIVIAYTSELSSTTITIEGSLTQYNHISDDMKFDNSYASAFANKIFSSDFAVLQYTDANNVKWVNTGIISMTETFAKANLNNGENPAGYTGLEASATVLTSTYKGFFWSVKPTQEALSVTPFEWKPEAQAPVIPKHSFEYPVKDGDKNYLAKVENDYCYYEEGKINISMDEGDTFEFDPAILTVTKNGHTLSYSVTMNGTDYTGKNISFNTSGDYAIVYTYIDTYNYVLNGEVIGTLDETYTKTIFVSVSVVEPDAKHAEFSFNGTTGIKTNIGDKTYISANVNATSNSWGAVTVNGQKVYYPIVSAYVKTETNQNERQVFFPVFEGVVTIIDYADGGKGAQVTYDGNTNTVANYPTNLTVAKGKYISAQGTSALDNSKFVLSDGTWTTGIQDIFLFSANKDLNPPPESVTAYNSELCYATGSQLALFKNSEPNSRNGMNYWTVQYKYQDNAGVSYYYYVGYYANCYQEKSSGGGCVTPDTLVTLADGTQKEIQYITYEDKLLVWDSFKGEYTVVPAAIIVNHGFDNWTVIELNFDDGTTVKLITAHAFLDADTNAWELINANNVQNYVGHSFVRADGDGYKTVKLISYNVYEEYTESYTLVSAGHYNFITENMFSLTNSFYGFVAGLEFGKNFTYDEEILQSDIQKYGLYTYETFSDYITEEQYIAFNGQFLKISVDKGYLDFNNIVSLIEEYLNK